MVDCLDQYKPNVFKFNVFSNEHDHRQIAKHNACLTHFNPCTAQLSWVRGSWIFCQTNQACLPRLGL